MSNPAIPLGTDLPACEEAIHLSAAMRTDVGVVRERNEDSALVDTDDGLFVVADGLGGHAAGEVASAIAVRIVRQVIADDRAYLTSLHKVGPQARFEGVADVLGAAVRAADAAVRHVARCEPDKHGMGTTLDAALVLGHEAFLAHVGDSRTYLVRDGVATQLTRDHTVAEAMRTRGDLTEEQASTSPLRSVLTNALGATPRVGVDLSVVTLLPGDQLLLCTDGLYTYFAPNELAMRLAWPEPSWGLGELVSVARQRGGHDNITGVLVALDDGHTLR